MDALVAQIAASNVTGWSAFGALALAVVLMVVRGTLIPGKTHERELATERTRGDEWKETALEGRRQNTLLIQGNEIVKDFFKKVTVDDGTGRLSGDGPTTGDKSSREQAA